MVVIIGGGITGLAAAFELTKRGVPFTLFEASPRVGGIIHTDRVDGFTIEAGPDSVLVQKPAALQLFDELGLAPDVIATREPRTAFVFARGRLYPLPSRSILGIPTTLVGVARYALLSPAARMRVALEPLVRARGQGDESVAAFFRRRFGRATVDLIAEPLLGGIHAGDIHALSVHSLFPRLVAAEARGSVLHAFRGEQRPAQGVFRSLRGGMGDLVAALDRHLAGSNVRTNARVDAVMPNAGRWQVTAGATTTDASAVIIAAPAPTAARLLSPIDARVGTLCGEVPYVSTASVTLAWPRQAIAHPLAGSGFVVSRAGGRQEASMPRITACTWISSKWEGRAPEGWALVRAFIGGAHDRDAVDLTDEELVDVAARDMSRVLGIRGAPSFSRVYRWRDAGAQHNVGQLARMAELERLLAAHPGLFVAGSGFRAVGIPDCVADGRGAAAAAATYVRIDS